MKKYLHIGINWDGLPKTAAVQKLIEAPGVVDDWLQYGGNCWVVYTHFDQSAWADYLKSTVGNGQLVIYEVTNLPQSNGLLPAGLWEWFNRFRF